MKTKELYFHEAINQAIKQSIQKDNKVIHCGLGVDDPKGVFGTTLDLHKKFKKNIFDMPTAENSMTGIALGISLEGYRPIIVHQRVEFSLLSLEQIINQIAKWRFMSGGKNKVSLVIRLIIGKGWGQGPQHSQSLEVLFSHIPGLKVVCPSNPLDAKGMLIESIFDNNPVIFFEHRWLHGTKSYVPEKFFKKDITKAKVLRKGKDLTIISYSNALIETLKASDFLNKNNINAEVIDLRVLRPLDKKTLIKSAKKTKKVLIVDNGMIEYGISSEISSLLYENIKKVEVHRIGVKDVPIPSTVSLAKLCYPEITTIVNKVLKILNKKVKDKIPERKNPDQPDISFRGPF